MSSSISVPTPQQFNTASSTNPTRDQAEELARINQNILDPSPSSEENSLNRGSPTAHRFLLWSPMSKRTDTGEIESATGFSHPYTHLAAADSTVYSETSPARKRRASGTTAATFPMSGLSSSAPALAAADTEDTSVSDLGMAPPPAKKSRTNTPWTPAEEQRLKTMKDAGNSWAEIAKTFPSRTEGSVKKHYYKDMHYAEFAEDESQALLNAIKDYETNKWKEIGKKVGKPAKACEQYAKEHFAGKM